MLANWKEIQSTANEVHLLHECRTVQVYIWGALSESEMTACQSTYLNVSLRC
jgi:hypothetical protein